MSLNTLGLQGQSPCEKCSFVSFRAWPFVRFPLNHYIPASAILFGSVVGHLLVNNRHVAFSFHRRKQNLQERLTSTANEEINYGVYYCGRALEYATDPRTLLLLSIVAYKYREQVIIKPVSWLLNASKAPAENTTPLSSVVSKFSAVLKQLHIGLDKEITSQPAFYAPIVSSVIMIPITIGAYFFHSAIANYNRRLEAGLFGLKEDYEQLAQRGKVAFEQHNFYEAAAFYHHAREVFKRLYFSELHRENKQATLVDLYINEAKTLFMSGKYDHRQLLTDEECEGPYALDVVTEALEYDQNSKELWNIQGIIHLLFGRNQQAIAAFDQSLRLDNSQTDIFIYNAYAHGDYARVLSFSDFDFYHFFAHNVAHVLLEVRGESAQSLLEQVLNKIPASANAGTLNRLYEALIELKDARLQDKCKKYLVTALECYQGAINAIPKTPNNAFKYLDLCEHAADLFSMLSIALQDEEECQIHVPIPDGSKPTTATNSEQNEEIITVDKTQALEKAEELYKIALSLLPGVFSANERGEEGEFHIIAARLDGKVNPTL
jgi:tetratricopeptide (TPR) repeat protein